MPVSGLGLQYPPGTRDIEIVMRAVAPRRFLVVDEQGRPVESFGFDVQEPRVHSTGGLRGEPHPGGEVWIAVQEGDIVRFGARGFLETHETVLPLSEGEAQRVVLEVGERVTGRVVYRGQPVAGAEVPADRERLTNAFRGRPYAEDYLWLNRKDMPGYPIEVAMDPRPSPRPYRSFEAKLAHTDEQGRFTLTGIDAASLSLEIRAAGGLGLFRRRSSGARTTTSATSSFDSVRESPGESSCRSWFSSSPAPLDLSLGDQEVRCELRTGSLELLLPEGLVAEEGTQLHLWLARSLMREARLTLRVQQGSLVDADRLRLGDLATRTCRIESVPEGPLEVTLEQQGRSLGSAAVVVSPGTGTVGVLR